MWIAARVRRRLFPLTLLYSDDYFDSNALPFDHVTPLSTGQPLPQGQTITIIVKTPIISIFRLYNGYQRRKRSLPPLLCFAFAVEQSNVHFDLFLSIKEEHCHHVLSKQRRQTTSANAEHESLSLSKCKGSDVPTCLNSS